MLCARDGEDEGLARRALGHEGHEDELATKDTKILFTQRSSKAHMEKSRFFFALIVTKKSLCSSWQTVFVAFVASRQAGLRRGTRVLRQSMSADTVVPISATTMKPTTTI